MPYTTGDTTSSATCDGVDVRWSPSRPGGKAPPRRRPRRSTRYRRAAWIAYALGAAALVFGGFRYWQDEVVVRRAQERLGAVFQERASEVAAGTPASAFAAPPGAAPAAAPTDVAVGDDADDPRLVLTTAGTDLDAVTAAVPGILHELPPAAGEVLGRIVIPTIGVDWMVVEGVELAFLAGGPGHMPWTPLPGQPGNAVISGHRTTRGAPFADLDRLQPGDEILVETLIGTHTYRVVDHRIVAPTGVWVTEQRDGAWLTLTTCNPKGSARERLVVFAHLVDGPNLRAIERVFAGPYVVTDPSGG
jgi:sortase A